MYTWAWEPWSREAFFGSDSAQHAHGLLSTFSTLITFQPRNVNIDKSVREMLACSNWATCSLHSNRVWHAMSYATNFLHGRTMIFMVGYVFMHRPLYFTNLLHQPSKNMQLYLDRTWAETPMLGFHCKASLRRTENENRLPIPIRVIEHLVLTSDDRL